MLISRETFNLIDPSNPTDRSEYANAVIDEIKGQKREFIADPDFGGWQDLNMRPVVQFQYGVNGWVKRLRIEPFCD